MDRIKILPLFVFTFSMSTLANDSKTINENNLYGLWNCKHTMEDRKLKMKIKIDYDVNVVRNGKSNGVGVLLFKIPNFPELAYSLSDNSQWKIKGGNLTLSSTELKLKNTSYPELEKMLNLRRLLPKNINESAKILELTKSKLKVQSKSDGGIYACSKISHKS
jgi:hypothetical protein